MKSRPYAQAVEPLKRTADQPSLARRAVAEGLGAGILLLAIVGSGTAADRLTDDAALTLFIHAVVIGLALGAAITAMGPVSGAHLNPAVTLSVAMRRGLAWVDVPAYVGAQLLGAFLGVVGANVMFDLPPISIGETARSGASLWFSEFIATFGLLAVIWGSVRLQAATTVSGAVGAYIIAAVWFTSSTAFANPAVTAGRILSDGYTGIAPSDAVPFIVAQLAGALAATLLFRWLVPALPRLADEAVIPHGSRSVEP